MNNSVINVKIGKKEEYFYGLVRTGAHAVSHPNLIQDQHTVHMWGLDISEYKSKNQPEKDTIRCKRWKIAESIVL